MRVERSGQIEVNCAPPERRNAAETAFSVPSLSRTSLARRKEWRGSDVSIKRLISFALTSSPSNSTVAPKACFNSASIVARKASSASDLRQNLMIN
ncbi:hypothetical protein [Lysobacter gummosus]|uniref:hypothetical protein n=1 Tax=Lysobacter gummosus TaxID=262324 RepID=UPI00363A8453